MTTPRREGNNNIAPTNFLLWVDPSIYAATRRILGGEPPERAEYPRLSKVCGFARALYPGQSVERHYIAYTTDNEKRAAWLRSLEGRDPWDRWHFVPVARDRDNERRAIEELEHVLLGLLDEVALLPGNLILALCDDYGEGALSARLRELRQLENGRPRRVTILHFDRSSRLLDTPFEQFDLVEIGTVHESVYERADAVAGGAQPLLAGSGRDQRNDSGDQAGLGASNLLGRASNGVAHLARRVRTNVASKQTEQSAETSTVTIPLGDHETLTVRRESARR